jgi:hypothetical protein
MKVPLIEYGKMGGATLHPWSSADSNQFEVAKSATNDLTDSASHVSKATDLPTGRGPFQIRCDRFVLETAQSPMPSESQQSGLLM